MSFFKKTSATTSRRNFLRNTGFLIAAGVVARPSFALASSRIDVTAPPYNAIPGQPDSYPAFKAALTAIENNGGGSLYIPNGPFYISQPLTYSGGSLTIEGDGQDSSVLINTHTGTLLTVNFAGTDSCLTVRDMGFSPLGSTIAQGAIIVNVPSGPSGWSNAAIKDSCFGVPWGANGRQYNTYNAAITFNNVTRGHIENVNVHSNGMQGGTAIALGGLCTDTRILGSTLEGYNIGVGVFSYAEGIHLTNNVIICGTALHTGFTNYNQWGNAINVLEIFMSECEINTSNECLWLYQVKNAQIKNCHFNGPSNNGGGSMVDMRGCNESFIDTCTFNSSWSPGHTSQNGIGLNPSGLVPTNDVSISNVQFENTTVAIYIGNGATDNVASNVQLLACGTGPMVNGATSYGNATQQVFVDMSGNTSNNVSWTTTSNATGMPGRRTVSQH